MKNPILQMKDIVKEFPGVKAMKVRLWPLWEKMEQENQHL